MKRFVEGEDRTQVTLLPECLDDFVGEDNPVRLRPECVVFRVGLQAPCTEPLIIDRTGEITYCHHLI